MIETPYYRITPYTDLLHIESYLSWDEKIVKKILADVKKMVATFYRDKNWGLLSDRAAWQLGTPEAEMLFSKTAPLALNETLTHIAIIVDESEIKKWQLKIMTEKYHKYETRFFDTSKDAELWLASFGYHKDNRTHVTPYLKGKQ